MRASFGAAPLAEPLNPPVKDAGLVAPPRLVRPRRTGWRPAAGGASDARGARGGVRERLAYAHAVAGAVHPRRGPRGRARARRSPSTRGGVSRRRRCTPTAPCRRERTGSSRAPRATSVRASGHQSADSRHRLLPQDGMHWNGARRNVVGNDEVRHVEPAGDRGAIAIVAVEQLDDPAGAPRPRARSRAGGQSTGRRARPAGGGQRVRRPGRRLGDQPREAEGQLVAEAGVHVSSRSSASRSSTVSRRRISVPRPPTSTAAGRGTPL